MSGEGVEIPPGLAGRLARTGRLVVLTGAGVSAESGVPTFRGADGLWNSYRAEDLATPEAFARDPLLVWRWYDWRRGLIRPLAPNPAHRALAELEARLPAVTLITQNVDSLHRLAGSRNILELHGNIWQLRCPREGTVREDRRVPLDPLPPCCEACGGLLRPHIVWFGESLDPRVWEAACEEASRAEILLVVGTSALVHPAAGLPFLGRRGGAYVVEVNLERTPLSDEADEVLLGRAGSVLPSLLDAAFPGRGADGQV